MDWPESNPEHWESLSLTMFDNDLLLSSGGTWDAPPPLKPGWETEAVSRPPDDPASVAARAFPTPGPIAWKDPRLCLLLPYWRGLLPPPVAIVLVWRSPLAVARSLARRDGMPMADGLALWERYNLAALANLRDQDVFVLDYSDFVANTEKAVTELAAWLVSLPQFASLSAGNRVGAAVSAVSRELDHNPWAGTEELPGSHREIVRILSELRGANRPLTEAKLPSECEITTTVIEARRKLAVQIVELKDTVADLRRQLHSLEIELWERRGELSSTQGDLLTVRAQLESRERDVEILQQTLANLRSSTSWKVTSPLRKATNLVREMKDRVR